MDGFLSRIDNSRALSQIIPLGLTLVVLAGLVTILHTSIFTLNMLPLAQPIVLELRWYDILIGLTVYLKTSIDFAILMGRLMATYPGWRGRVAIEIGTAIGNGAGTIAIIALWILVKNVNLILALMILLAALVLFELAYGSLDQLTSWEEGGIKKYIYITLHRFLDVVKKITDPLVSRLMPDLGAALQGKTGLSWRELLTFSMSVPFILGLDDFAGYVPLFSIVNVYGFALGVLGAHTLLNIALFLNPQKTVQAVKNEYVALAGALAFIGLAAFGIAEAVKILLSVV